MILTPRFCAVSATGIVVLLASLTTSAGDDRSSGLSGELKKWHAVTISFRGPKASETDNSPNPFLDYRLQVVFTGPSGQRYNVPGFFDGDGDGSGTGDVWTVRFTPDEVGKWQYKASFRTGEKVAVSLDPAAGRSSHFDGEAGSFTVAERDPAAPGFLRWGRLEYVGKHYLKFRDGSYWIKGGTDSPENFLAYRGFDNTPGGRHEYAGHVADWTPGDPDWGDGAGKGIIGALNYLGSKHVNSIYFLPMNIGGDGKDTWPFVGPIAPDGSPSNDNLHYDISKLWQWEIVFDHAQRKGIFLHFVLNEAEAPNKRELDNAELGVERKLFYREMVARFAHHNALQWNISEEYDLDLNLGPDRVKQFAEYIQAVDPYDHPITVHHAGKNPEPAWLPFLGDKRFSITSFQYYKEIAGWGREVEKWRKKTADAGRPLPICLDEVRWTTPDNQAEQRKDLVWPTLLSGGHIEHFLYERLDTEDFRQFENLWLWTWYARKFMEENLPFYEMEPHDELLGGAAASDPRSQVFAKVGEVYAVYLADGSQGASIDLPAPQSKLEKRWYNPRTGEFEGTATILTARKSTDLGEPPGSPPEDWVILFTKADWTDRSETTNGEEKTRQANPVTVK
jgi:hypothetical protein